MLIGGRVARRADRHRHSPDPSRLWGIQSQDMFGSLRAAYFGFRVGNVTVSLSSMLTAVGVFVIGVLITRAVQRWLGERCCRALGSTRASAIRSTRSSAMSASGLAVGGSAQLGLNFQTSSPGRRRPLGRHRLRPAKHRQQLPLRPHPVVGARRAGRRLGGDRRRAGLRAAHQRARDGSRDFRSRDADRPQRDARLRLVKNWVHNDRVGRIIIALNVLFETDADLVRELLIGVAKAQDLVLSIPAPLVLFNDFGDWGLKFHAHRLCRGRADGRARALGAEFRHHGADAGGGLAHPLSVPDRARSPPDARPTPCG